MNLVKNLYLLLLVAFFAACSGYEPETSVTPREELTAGDVLAANNYSILVDAITRTGIDVGTGNTLFAPNNAAFEAAFAQLGISGLDDLDDATLTSILQYHVVAGELLSADITTGIVSAASGDPINVIVTEDAISLNARATVVDADRLATSGVIHGINQVLLAPVGNLVEILSTDDDFETLTAAVVAAGLDGTFSGTTNYTVFAPNDAAFAALGLDAANIGGIFTAEELVEILSFHVVAGNTFSIQLPDAALLETILGAEADEVESLIYNDGEIITYLGGQTNSASALVSVNTLASNGVIHEVDNVLLPLGNLRDLLDPIADTPRSGSDGVAGSDLDKLGTIVEGLAYEPLLTITEVKTVFVPQIGLEYADFATDEEALDYLERYVFEGNVSVSGAGNGGRITSIGGDEYYVAIADGDAYVNGLSTDRFGPYAMYDGNGFRYTESFTPIPDTDVLTALNDAGYTKFAAVVELLGLEADLDAGDNTIFAVDNALIDAIFGVSLTEAEILGLTGDATLAFLEELALNHVAGNANFAIHIALDLPELTAASGETLFFADDGDGNPVIILDDKDPVGSQVGIVNVDIIYGNGVIHEVDDAILF